MMSRLALLLAVVAASPPGLPGHIEPQRLLPSEPIHLKVDIGHAKFLRFSCMGGPADVVISLSTYQLRADPFLFLSLDPEEAPTFQRNDASSLGLWRENHLGSHYVIAKSMGPSGGILGVANMPHFAAEELEANVDIKCIFIIAFDALFWDHLRMSSVCPVGSHVHVDGDFSQALSFCSGHGTCGKHGNCQCDGDYAGAACEHSKTDVVVAADGHYNFKVATDRYQYFRVRIPPRFPGGFLNVKLMASEHPLVVLVRSGEIPSKTNFEISNFADWLDGQYISMLKFKVDPPPGISTIRSFPAHGPARALDDNGTKVPQCPKILPHFTGPSCSTAAFADCQSSCRRCMTCVKATNNGVGDNGCTEACGACTSPHCVDTLGQCASDVKCKGPDSEPAVRCERNCGHCMSCFDSNDARCRGCECCLDCLPVAARCGSENDRFVFVGIYNHRRSLGDRGVVNAVADVQLSADPNYLSLPQPNHWIQDLYDPFHDIRFFQVTQRQVYPEGERFIFVQNFSTESPALTAQVQLFNKRATLLRIGGISLLAEKVSIRLEGGPLVSHVLSTTQSAPKTFFDFDKTHENKQGVVEVLTRSSHFLWVAFFADGDGDAEVTAVMHEVTPQAPAFGFAVACVFSLLCSMAVLAVIYGGAQRVGNALGVDSDVSLLERLGCWIRSQGAHESTVGLTRQGSLSGYVGSDVIDRSVEDQYLHRGGIGDDGI